MIFRCATCQATYPTDTGAWCCECGGVFELEGAPPFSPGRIRSDVPTLWRYQAMLPVTEIVSLGEGFTPFVPLHVGNLPVLCKLEFLAPTGSFKDRGAAVLVSALRMMGVTEVVEDSSGNAAASLAAYCARAGIHARIFVPARASPAKLNQIAVYGADVVPVEGPRENAALAAQDAAGTDYYASHNYSPFFVQGTKTFAYEVWEHLGGRTPGNVILPLGNGSLLLGAYLGFMDLHIGGLIERVPRLFGVQSRACAPFYEAYQQGLEDAPPISPGETIAEGIRIARPSRGRQVLRAVRSTDGGILAVNDDEIREARTTLSQMGLFVEPTSATAVAAVHQLENVITPDEITVVALTGSGLKSPA